MEKEKEFIIDIYDFYVRTYSWDCQNPNCKAINAHMGIIPVDGMVMFCGFCGSKTIVKEN